MKLTGKCKEEFEKSLIFKFTVEYYEFGISENEILLNALIIEFFDSVGIYITVMACNDKTFDSELRNNKINIMTSQFMEKRTEAINEAIIKANEIFNLNKQNNGN